MSDDDTSGGDDWFESAFDDGAEPADDPAEDGHSGGSEPAADESDERAADSPADGASSGDGTGDTAAGSDADGGTFGDGSSFEEEIESTAFGGDAGGDGDGLFDSEGFASAFEGAGGDAEFDDEEFETAIPRIDLGIEGLDNMIQGGVPERHLMVAIGSAGTGKTTFGLQFLNHGLRNGENTVFITLEQSREAIIGTASERGWEFDRYESEGALAVVDLDPVEMANSLDNIQAELPELIENFAADRLVLDSVSLLEMMYDDQARRRTEVFDFTRALKKAGVTTFLTSEASESNPYASRHGIIEYLTDAVFVLQYVRGETQETRLAVEIQKIRNANHSREKKPYEMTDRGISVYQQANIF
ncbi:KaiC domain-containing protein [Halobacteriales archaeon QS_4_66_20]|nr:MAG: KaiC domain-containing protein [Halobacteriales archaeon QS_4_66_20]